MTDKVHGNTKKAADVALAKRQISRESYEAILRGELALANGKALGRGKGPDSSEGRSGSGRASEEPRRSSAGGRREGTDAPRTCLCGCGEPVQGKKSRFRPGHDARLHGELKRNLEKDPLLRNERFSDAQREYAKERGLI